jgi:hypothetical protein
VNQTDLVLTPTYPVPEIGKIPTQSVNAPFGAVASQHTAVVQVAMGDGRCRGVTSGVQQVTWDRAI